MFLFLLFFFQSHLLDKIVATVNEKPITLSEVNLIKEIEGNINDKEAIEKAINLNLKFQEAIKFINPVQNKEEIERIIKENNLEINPLNFEFFSKLLTIKNYVENIISPNIYLKDEEILEYLKEKNLPEKDLEEIKKLFFLKKLNEEIEKWEKKLKEDAKIKILN